MLWRRNVGVAKLAAAATVGTEDAATSTAAAATAGQKDAATPQGRANRSPRTLEGKERRSVAGGFGGTRPGLCRAGVRRAAATASITTYTMSL